MTLLHIWKILKKQKKWIRTLYKKYVIPESELACLDACNDSRASTQTEEARQKDKNAFKIEGKDTFWLKSFQTHQKINLKCLRNATETI